MSKPVISVPHGIGWEIINALGAPAAVIDFRLDIQIGKPITATIKYHPTRANLSKLPAVLAKYQLTNREEVDPTCQPNP